QPTQFQSVAAGTTDLKLINEINERALIIQTLEKVRFNKSKAAQLLNIDRKTLYNKMRLYDIE
ncbi:MAG TPA: helix-turn-helix domain-containing protein, partial [Bacteroidales bacterium]|nr:helix-turn-helix domain-containing protein [Bacteroidales bacterium]